MLAPTSSLIESAVKAARNEFGDKADLFKAIVLRMNDLNGSDYEDCKFPGVYVLVHEDKGYIKVGKSQSNASKRALEHFSKSITVKEYVELGMSGLRQSERMYMLIFALQNQEKMHWVLALEHYLERELKPSLQSKRNG